MVHLLLAIIYLSFISLGLPDSLLGSAWPSMYQGIGVPLAFGGVLSMLISGTTILSSLWSCRAANKLGTGKVTVISVGLTAAALFGFSISNSFWMLCLWTIPYGLGAGAVDAVLNNFVAVHFEAKHMSWLHCFWGVGASVGPFIMGACLTNQLGWNQGYRAISMIQIVLTVILIFSLPLWKRKDQKAAEVRDAAPMLRGKDAIALPCAKQVMFAFFCYCAIESGTGLWGSSYMVMEKGVTPEKAAFFISLFYLGITLGRFLSGFLTMRFHSQTMILMGEFIVVAGVLLLWVSSGEMLMCAGFVLIGLGCAPIFPSLIHETPERFGESASQVLMGMQMACAYVGSTFVPPVIGFLVENVSVRLFPVVLLVFAVLMVAMLHWARRLNPLVK